MTVVALGLAAFALMLDYLLLVQIGRLRRAYDALVPAGSFVEVAEASTRTAASLRREVDALRTELAMVRTDVAGSLRHVAVVRYDAFADLGGQLSFSAALLDDAGDGLVITSINGRSETRSYAKGVAAGRSEHALSPEEQEAMSRAARPAPPRQREG